MIRLVFDLVLGVLFLLWVIFGWLNNKAEQKIANLNKELLKEMTERVEAIRLYQASIVDSNNKCIQAVDRLGVIVSTINQPTGASAQWKP